MGKSEALVTVSAKPVSRSVRRYGGARRKRNRKNRSTITSGGLLGNPSPFPLVWKRAKQIYGDIATLTVGASGTYGTPTEYTLNDQYDPRFSVGGHQPYARDTFDTLYSRYKVVGVTVEAIFTSPSINGLSCGLIFRNPSQATTIAGKSIPYIREIPVATQKVIANTGTQRYHFKKYFPMHKIMGVSKLVFDADTGIYDALSSGSPDSTYGMGKLEVAVSDSNGGSSGTVNSQVQITMHTNWYQRKILTQS